MPGFPWKVWMGGTDIFVYRHLEQVGYKFHFRYWGWGAVAFPACLDFSAWELTVLGKYWKRCLEVCVWSKCRETPWNLPRMTPETTPSNGGYWAWHTLSLEEPSIPAQGRGTGGSNVRFSVLEHMGTSDLSEECTTLETGTLHSQLATTDIPYYCLSGTFPYNLNHRTVRVKC